MAFLSWWPGALVLTAAVVIAGCGLGPGVAPGADSSGQADASTTSSASTSSMSSGGSTEATSVTITTGDTTTSGSSSSSGSTTTSPGFPVFPPQACISQEECPDGYFCTEIDYQDPSERYCLMPFDGWRHACDPFKQDCPEGFKCLYFAAELDAGACVPIVGAGDHGEPCVSTLPLYVTNPGSEWSQFVGPDTCDATSQCLFNGTCRRLCEGSDDDAECPLPMTFCGTGRVNYWCFEYCDPLQPECAWDEVCVPYGDAPSCVPSSGVNAGLYESCDSPNDCQEGLICVNSAAVKECEQHPFTCCARLCALQDPEPCDGKAQACIPWYEDWYPDEWSHFGVCAVP